MSQHRPSRIVLSAVAASAIVGLGLASSIVPAAASTPEYIVTPTVITVSSFPLGAVVTPNGKQLLVANNNGQSISVISTSTNTVTSTVNLAGGSYPVNIVMGADGKHAWFTDAGRTAFSSLNLTNNVVTDFTTNQKPGEIAISPDGSTAITTSYQNDKRAEITNLSTSAVTDLNVTGTNGDPEGVVFSPDGTHAYITNAGAGTLSVLNLAGPNVSNTITLGGSPYGIALSHDGKTAYVTDQNGDSVWVVNTATAVITATITVGASPAHISISPDGTTAFVANRGTDTVSVIDLATNTVTQTLTVGSGPWDAAWAPNGKTIYVTNDGDGTVSVVKLNTPTSAALPTTGVDVLPAAAAAAFLLFLGLALVLIRNRRRLLAVRA